MRDVWGEGRGFSVEGGEVEVVGGVDEFEEGGLKGVGVEAEGLYLGVEAGGVRGEFGGEGSWGY